jgi:hypothetical protein
MKINCGPAGELFIRAENEEDGEIIAAFCHWVACGGLRSVQAGHVDVAGGSPIANGKPANAEFQPGPRPKKLPSF